MENVQMLLQIEPEAFWRQLRNVVKEVIQEKDASSFSPPRNSKEGLLKATQVCEIFKVSKPTLYSWLNQGKIKSVKIQSRRYFLWEDIEVLIKASRSEVQPTSKEA
jgi:predicted DNA-binding transcriptional regulator AlpA